MFGWGRGGFVALAAVCLLSRGESNSAAPIICFFRNPVDFEIVEGVPDKKTWDFDAAEPTTRFTARAFALAGLPKKYNEKGVIDDRAAPFLVRGTARMEFAKGKYRLLLRARGAARLWID